jgi:hypothetical protein
LVKTAYKNPVDETGLLYILLIWKAKSLKMKITADLFHEVFETSSFLFIPFASHKSTKLLVIKMSYTG